jgi:hypothetical protein
MKMTNEQIKAKYPQTAERIIGERRVIRRLITEAFKLGYNVSIHNGEDWEVRYATTEQEVMDNIMATDQDTLRLCDSKKMIAASFALIYGNSPAEVIADHSTNALAEALYELATAGEEP